MELQGIGIEGVGLGRGIRCGVVRCGVATGIATVTGAVIADATEGIYIGVSADGKADGTAVGGADNIALHIRAEQFYICVTQTADYLIVRMTVGVPLFAGDYRILGHNIPKELVTGGGGRTVVSNFQHGGTQVVAAVYQGLFYFLLRVTGE